MQPHCPCFAPLPVTERNFTRPIHVRIHATLAGKTVLIDGTAETEVRMPCSRCLEPFDMKIETDFSTTAVPEVAAQIDPAATDDIELAATDMDVLVYSGDDIDLRDEIAQQIIMALPFKPLCRDACKGLCSRCGADLNQKPASAPLRMKAAPLQCSRHALSPITRNRTP